jgi:hypothetical protein
MGLPTQSALVRRQVQIVALSTLVLLLLINGASAHGPPAKREFEERLLADCVDDYFGGDLVSSKDGHDVIALDVHEQHDVAFSADVLRFKLLFNGGFGGGNADTLRLDVKLTTPTGAKTIALTTTDNKVFTGTGADRVDPAASANDGTRMYVEFVIKTSTLGLHSGQKISQFRVDAYYDGTRGDYMPGTYEGAVAGGQCAADAGAGAPYQRPDYIIRGPFHYGKLSPSTKSISMEKGASQIVPMTVENLLRSTQQKFTVTVSPPSGITAKFHNPVTNQYTSELNVDLAGGASTSAHLSLTADDDNGGEVQVVLTSQYGGRSEATVTVALGTAAPSAPASSAPASSGSDASAPSAGFFTVVLVATLSAWLARRRT